MKHLAATILFLLAACSAYASEGERSEAAILLELTGTEQMLNQTMGNMLELQIQQNPALAPFKEVMLEFFEKYMGYESLKPELLRLYNENFTEQELKELNDFYRTDTGKKSIELMPYLVQQGSMIGVQRFQANQDELRRMIELEAARIGAE